MYCKMKLLRIGHHFVLICLFHLFLLNACHNDSNIDRQTKAALTAVNLESALGFRVAKADGYKLLELLTVEDQRVYQSFCLVDQNGFVPHDLPENIKIIPIPVKSMVCLSATHIAFADALGLMDKIVGVASADYVFSARFSDLVSAGNIKEIGIADHFKLEELIHLMPGVVLTNAQEGQNYELLRKAGLTVIPVADYLENDPLGRVEWLRFFGLLFGKEEEASALFDSIKTDYNRLKSLAAQVTERPVVLSGKQYGGFWNLPGGKSYLATMLHDAGAKYLWQDNPDTGSLTLDFETVYYRGVDADYWRFLMYSPDDFSYGELLAEDARYAGFKAFKTKKVFFCNTFKKPYFQKGALEPHVLLADYIFMFHPELMPGYQPVYYEFLK